ncbi:hypothetical protein K431DRAFT_304355 [Polychaeton citri CBS 116435]|uniref:Methyltransferase domain-containing protein n=1 Tax=Polychaeton citri CBS 116435 TaxID=1314669 RepID=A0A9P4Q6T7_9PEZI|nr:hypothetical protein K431DRAFT_304355 [Polychaeton citri CBS 116435]
MPDATLKAWRILDIGCGTGIITTWLARQYPDAEVVGVDISAVPGIHKKPPNVTYLQGNVAVISSGS